MAHHSEAEIEAEIQAKGKTAPRLTPDYITDQIKYEFVGRASDLFKTWMGADDLSTLTVAILVLRNGFTVIGESACASPENYDGEIGAKIALDNARQKIWALEGYVLRSKLAGLV